MNLFTRLATWLDNKAADAVEREVRAAELERYRRTLEAMGLDRNERRFGVVVDPNGIYHVVDTHAAYAVSSTEKLQSAEETALMANFYWHTTANREGDC